MFAKDTYGRKKRVDTKDKDCSVTHVMFIPHNFVHNYREAPI